MNHRIQYNKIIQKAQSENRIKHKGIYYESHHIRPKCLGGTNDKINIVNLTAKEHYVCHKLLTYIYPKNHKIISALFRMTYDKKGKHNISSSDYAYAKELKSIAMSNRIILPSMIEKLKEANLGKKYSDEVNKSKGRSGSANGMYGTKRSFTYEAKEHICPYCGLKGKGGNMKRYHFDNCNYRDGI